MRLFKLFKKRKTEELAFHTGTSGVRAHREFIDSVDERGIKIINSWITYHDYSSSHKPAYINYVISYKI